jgi:hypothetical protein
MTATLTRRTQKKPGLAKNDKANWITLPGSERWDLWIKEGTKMFGHQVEKLEQMTLHEIDEVIKSKLPPKYRNRCSGPVSYDSLLEHAIVYLKETAKLMNEEMQREASRIDKANTRAAIESSAQQRLDHPSADDVAMLTEAEKLMAATPPIAVLPAPDKSRTITIELAPLNTLNMIIPQLTLREVVGLNAAVAARLVELTSNAKSQETSANQQKVQTSIS